MYYLVYCYQLIVHSRMNAQKSGFSWGAVCCMVYYSYDCMYSQTPVNNGRGGSCDEVTKDEPSKNRTSSRSGFCCDVYVCIVIAYSTQWLILSSLTHGCGPLWQSHRGNSFHFRIYSPRHDPKNWQGGLVRYSLPHQTSIVQQVNQLSNTQQQAAHA